MDRQVPLDQETATTIIFTSVADDDLSDQSSPVADERRENDEIADLNRFIAELSEPRALFYSTA
ncbi:MAG: hypothetical protein ACLQT7_07635 [Candidatus Dormibacteria bacterium]